MARGLEALVSNTWRNWGRNQLALPAKIVRPQTEAELSQVIARAMVGLHKVKVVGSGHSFTDIACTDGVLIDVGAFNQIEEIDTVGQRVTVGAGIVLGDLNGKLHEHGLALPNLGDIDAQTLAGATATGTHGTGAGYQCISAAIVGARLATGDGGVIEVSESNRPDLLAGIQVGLGALGVLTQVTLQCVPAFNLHAVESMSDIDEVLDGFDAAAQINDHVEFLWLPHTRTAQYKVNNRTAAPVARRTKLKAFLNDEMLGNVGFGALQRISRRVPRAVPTLVSAVAKPGDRVEYVAPSHEVFCSKRRIRFVEMEYAVRREDLLEAFGRVRMLVDQLGRPISFPIEVRVLGADDIPLSMASGRDVGFIAVHVYSGTEHEAYFSAVEQIMADYSGRPHWGKLHRQRAETLAPLYPGWDAFQQVLAELDPDGHFSNPYLDRVLRQPGFRARMR